jgi:hypothetical protein
MYITYEFNNWWKYHFAIFTWKISQHFESLWSPSSLVNCYISLEMPVSSQGHYGFHNFPVVDWFCLFIHLWVLTLPLEDCSEFDNFVITLTEYLYHRWPWIYSFCHQHIPALLPWYSLIYYFAMLTIVSLFVFFFLYFLYFLISINGFCLLRWYLQTFRWQTHNREEVTE